MISNILKIYPYIKDLDFRILSSIEINMNHREWVPIYEIQKYTHLSFEKILYRLSFLIKYKLVNKTTNPYEGYRLFFIAYDILAFRTYIKRNVFHSISHEIGTGKESIVLEVQKKDLLFKNKDIIFILKIHREGFTSFKHVKRTRNHLLNKDHFSWIYASRLAAEKEYNILKKLYPYISVPQVIDHNRHTLIIENINGIELSKIRLSNYYYYFRLIILEIKKLFSIGIIHNDLSEYNIFILKESIKIIDWPQYVTIQHPYAIDLL